VIESLAQRGTVPHPGWRTGHDGAAQLPGDRCAHNCHVVLLGVWATVLVSRQHRSSGVTRFLAS
jgi:hypothetical protein